MINSRSQVRTAPLPSPSISIGLCPHRLEGLNTACSDGGERSGIPMISVVHSVDDGFERDPSRPRIWSKPTACIQGHHDVADCASLTKSVFERANLHKREP